jgi:hypothetical protein
MTAKELADSGVGDPIAKLEEFALDPALAPTWVFGGDADDQAAHHLGDRRPSATESAAESSPPSADQFPVPAEECGRSKEQTPGRQSAAESCQDQAVRWKQLWLLDMAAKDGDLVSDGQQLEIALGLRPGANQEQVEEQSHQGIDGRQQRGRGT